MKTRITLAILGHPGVTGRQVRRAISDKLKRLDDKYEVAGVVVIEDDDIGSYVQKVAKRLGLRTEVATRTTHIGNFLPTELTVGMTMWMASHFVLTDSEDPWAYSSIARIMCKRMPRKWTTLNYD